VLFSHFHDVQLSLQSRCSMDKTPEQQIESKTQIYSF